MKWATIKQHLRRIWLVQTKDNLSYLSASVMLSGAYHRQWDDYPWRVTDTVRFTCLSTLTDLYLVEQTLTRQFKMSTGEVKTEVEQRTTWKAILTTSHYLAELGNKARVIGLIPERMILIFDDKEFMRL